jgi:hypothetical protein
MTDVDKSIAKRTGKFKLLEDGTLEGTSEPNTSDSPPLPVVCKF